ncbi:hypothetical protein ACP26E_03415 [Franconibacter pulveris 601]|uniref:Inner membrane protein n=1 Tax=Franconibacter pulveris TaxID=435910 RepID=A0A0J8VNA7_9ENTR|nr:hypothetical protein [Franconibacter pulveris]KMV34596.1 hypothetical protein ACH50_10615 [Franconibacter pulveris]
MKNKFRLLLWLIYLLGLLFLFLFSGNKYAWMAEIDPSVSLDSIQNNSDNNMFAFFMLCALIGVQVLVFVLEKGMRKVIPALIALFTVLVYALLN